MQTTIEHNRIYISGANGFIGSRLVHEIKKHGLPEIETIPHTRLIRYPYQDFQSYFYLSGYGNHSHQTDIHQTIQANISQLDNTLMRVSKKSFKNFIHISTSSVGLKEQTPYSRTKSWAEELVVWYAKHTGKAFISVRPYSIFGEGEADFRFIPTMVRHLVERTTPLLVPEPSHDWVYVGDFCDALIALSENVTEHITTQEIGYGYATTNRQVFRDIVKILGLPGKTPYERILSMRAYDVSRSWYKHTTDHLDSIWTPQVGYWEGLKRTVSYYEEKYAKN